VLKETTQEFGIFKLFLVFGSQLYHMEIRAAYTAPFCSSSLNNILNKAHSHFSSTWDVLVAQS
jgi:hypothetical protein